MSDDIRKAMGSKDVSVRGREWCTNMLKRYEEDPPAIDQGIADSLREFVVRRESEIPMGIG